MAPEVTRRLVHASGTAVPAAHLLFPAVVTWHRVRVALVVGSLVVALIEGLRLGAGLDWGPLDALVREYERDNVAGYALYAWGGTLVAVTFDPPVAVPALLMLTVADPVSGLLGSGELRSVKRTYVLLAMFGTSTLIATFFVPTVPAILGGLAATAADGAKPVVRGYVVDDNLTIPIAAAVAMFVGLTYLPA